jgi:hypothetical protein
VIPLTDYDRDLLRSMGIAAESTSDEQRLDGTCRLLLAMGLPLTRENYLRLAFMGNPPQEPLDGELEAELPEEFRMWDADDICDAPSAGWCGEPSHPPMDPDEDDEDDEDED